MGFFQRERHESDKSGLDPREQGNERENKSGTIRCEMCVTVSKHCCYVKPFSIEYELSLKRKYKGVLKPQRYEDVLMEEVFHVDRKRKYRENVEFMNQTVVSHP